MIKTINFLSMEKQLLSLRQAHQQAKEEREYEKGHQTLWQKTKDVFGVTSKEALVEKTQKELEEFTQTSKATLARFCEGHDQSFIANDENLKKLHTRFSRWESKSDSVLAKLQSGRDAMRLLQEAKEQCEGASNMELMDVVSGNAGLTLMSHLETSEAQEALETAGKAIETFKTRLKKNPLEENEELGGADLHTNLNIQLLLDVGFGYFSWLNMGKLDDGAEKCQEVFEKIEKVVKDIDDVYQKVQKEKDNSFDALKEELLPLRKQVACGFSPILYRLLPQSWQVVDANNNDDLPQDTTQDTTPTAFKR